MPIGRVEMWIGEIQVINSHGAFPTRSTWPDGMAVDPGTTLDFCGLADQTIKTSHLLTRW